MELTLIGHSLVDYARDGFASVQNEILICLAAVMIHMFVFRRSSLTAGKKKGAYSKGSKMASPSSTTSSASHYEQEPTFSTELFCDLQSALNNNDFATTLQHLECLRQACRKGMSSPPAAAAALFQQAGQLAIKEQSMSQLLQKLAELGLVEHALDIMLVECVRGAHMEPMQDVRETRKAQGLQFGEVAYSALIQDATKPGQALMLFLETAALRAPTADLLRAASESALKHDDTPLANAILQKLPSPAPPEAAGGLLRFYGGGPASSETDAELLRMYNAKFKDVDISCDPAAMHIIAMASIRSATPKEGEEKAAGDLTVLKDMLSATSETAHIALIKEVGSGKQVGPVLAVLKNSQFRGTCIFNIAIEACVECRSIEEAEQVLAVAVKSRDADNISYNLIIKAYAQTKKPQKALQLVETMVAEGIPPNGATYNHMLDAAVQVNIQAVWKVFDEMCATRLRPNRITCTILLRAMRAGTKPADVNRIMTVLDQIDEELDDVLLSSVVDACIRANRPELLTARLKKYRDSGRSTEILQITRSHTYGDIIRAYGFTHDLEMVWETWREMLARQVTPAAVTLGCMAEALATNGETDAAYNLISDMLKREVWRPLVNSVIYCSVLKGFSHQKRFDKVWQVYEEMVELKLKFTSHTFTSLIDACARNSEMGRIPPLLKDMRSQGIQPCIMIYGAMVKGCCQHYRIEEAFAVVKDMEENTDCRPDEIMYNTLLDGCARKGLYDMGIKVLEDMQRNGVPPTNFTLSVVVKLATRSLLGSRAEKIDKAFALCESVAAKHGIKMNVHVYNNLMNTCILNLDVWRAYDTMIKMLAQGVRADARTYTLLIKACVANSWPHEAAGLLRAATGLKGTDPRLAKFDVKLLKPDGGLPAALIEEALEAINKECREEKIAVQLLQEFRSAPGAAKLDPRLQFRLATDLLK